MTSCPLIVADLKAIDKALPRGVYAQTKARFFDEAIHERPSTDSRVIFLAKGDHPGQLEEGDLQQARRLQRQLVGVGQGTAATKALSASTEKVLSSQSSVLSAEDERRSKN